MSDKKKEKDKYDNFMDILKKRYEISEEEEDQEEEEDREAVI